MRDKENEIQLATPIEECCPVKTYGDIRLVETHGRYRWQYRDNVKDDWRWVVLQTEKEKVLVRLARALADDA